MGKLRKKFVEININKKTIIKVKVQYDCRQ